MKRRKLILTLILSVTICLVHPFFSRSFAQTADQSLMTSESVKQLLMQAGQTYYEGNYPQVITICARALDAAKGLGYKEGVVISLLITGNAHGALGNYAEALDYYGQSLKLSQDINNKALAATNLSNIGMLHNTQGEHEQALGYLNQSMKLAHEIGDEDGIVRGLANIGVAYQMQGNYARALRSYQECLKRMEKAGAPENTSVLLTNIGSIYVSQGNYAQALEHYRRSIALDKEAGNKENLARTLNNVGVTHYLQREYATALEYSKQSLVLSEELQNKTSIAQALNNVGLVHNAQGNYGLAMEFSRKSLTLAESIGNKEKIADALLNIGRVLYFTGKHAEAVDVINRAIAIAKQIGISEDLWEAYTIKGRAYRALDQPKQARESFTNAIALVESSRHEVVGDIEQQQLFLEDKISPYHEMVELLISQGQNNITEAFEYAERAKGRVLLDVLRNHKVSITKSMTSAEQTQEQRLNAEILKLNTQVIAENNKPQPDQPRLADLDVRLRQARLDYESFQTDLYAAHPELKTHRGEIAPITRQQAAALIPDANFAVLKYVITDEKTYLFVLTKNRTARSGEEGSQLNLRIYPLAVTGKLLAEKVATFRTQLAERQLDFSVRGRELYDMLVRPAQQQLAGKKTLCIVPDGPLWELSFQALQVNSRYLIENYAIFYTPSLSVLHEMMRRPAIDMAKEGETHALLAFGNPDFGSEALEKVSFAERGKKLVPLPEAEIEVRKVAAIHGLERSKIYLGKEALEERAKGEAPGYRVLHFATHGFLDNVNPMYSYLVLAQGDGTQQDGLLETREIINLNLRADLAVLSACETARGRYGAGEGTIGMTWAFFIAGTPATLASQWNVESSSTSQLMVEFHQNWLKPDSNPMSMPAKAAALRKAGLQLLSTKEFWHPYYWAGFTLIGNPR
ncbi:MAG: CHAT domain-containing protein [Pyrinomonadaceae bacterium]|nr:CHAT domain-containing protein [Pyrinomonadaceae bacterium]